MANVQKYTRADVGGGSLTRHYERARDEHGNFHQWGNQDIDPSRSHLNYNLAPERDGGQLAFVSNRLSEVKCHNRDDVNIMCSWIITAPKDLAEDEHMLFFKESYDFLCDKYGEKNVISSWVHMDEASPHLHFAFIPVVIDKKKGHEKVSAKEALGWSERGLHKFHYELDAHMTSVFGRNIGVLNEATRDGNKEIWELKRESAITKAKNALEAEIRPIEGKIAMERHTNRLEDGIKEKKSIFSDKTSVVITVDDMTADTAKAVLNAARTRDKMRLCRDAAIKERDEAVAAKDVAVEERDLAVSKLQGIEQRELEAKTSLEAVQNRQAQADALYQQQLQLNELHKQAIAERDSYKKQLDIERQKATAFISENVTLQEKLTGAWDVAQNAVQAIGLLRHTVSVYNRGNLTPEQEQLVDAVANYAESWARKDGFHEHAENINKTVRISEGMRKEIQALEPKRNRAQDFER